MENHTTTEPQTIGCRRPGCSFRVDYAHDDVRARERMAVHVAAHRARAVNPELTAVGR